MIFTKEHIEKIVRGLKTQTRRVGKLRWSIGKIYGIKSSYYERAKHYIQVLSIRREPLNHISVQDAKAEGGYSPLEFVKGFLEMHKKRGLTPNDWVWVLQIGYVGERKIE